MTYRMQMRMWALMWRGTRRTSPHEASVYLMEAITFRNIDRNFVGTGVLS
ncbi:MAG TPA: hypothetical protein VGH19_16035 [Verrucomicrobiae bacterium]